MSKKSRRIADVQTPGLVPLTNGQSMNGLPQRLLLLVVLPLAIVSSVCAESVATVQASPEGEVALSAQPKIEGSPSVPVEQGMVSPAGETGVSGVAVPAATSEPAAEPLKVTRLEPGVTSTVAMTAEERHLEARKTDFLKFAAQKLKDMNRNHILSRERMRIEKRPDGSYRASFHQLDDSSMSCQVSRSPSKGAQYVAVLSYKERVFTTSCRTPADCRQGEFAPAEVIPNRHIFVYNNGAWQ